MIVIYEFTSLKCSFFIKFLKKEQEGLSYGSQLWSELCSKNFHSLQICDKFDKTWALNYIMASPYEIWIQIL